MPVAPVVGLTGGIGSGKSAVADCFSRQGIVTVDTDVIAHELTGAQGAAMPAIVAAFGREVIVPDGGMNRPAMRQRVFADPAAKAQLEAILHPMIREESRRRCQSASSPYVLLAVPLLVETGVLRQEMQRVLVVDCSEATQLVRVMARSGLSASEVEAILRTQASRAERLAIADDVLVNEGRLDALATQVQALHRRYLDGFGVRA